MQKENVVVPILPRARALVYVQGVDVFLVKTVQWGKIKILELLASQTPTTPIEVQKVIP